MNNITFKIALKGEGKTKWLLDIANRYADNHKIYIITENVKDYDKFCKKYFKLYNKRCPVEQYTKNMIEETDIILIDELFKHRLSFVDIEFFQRSCYKLFITIEGTLSDDFEEEESTIYDQLTIEEFLAHEFANSKSSAN